MATCPNCKGAMSVTAPVCPHCGYDFPLQKPEKPQPRGIAYSALADFALVIGMISAAIGALGMLILCGAAVLDHNFRAAFEAALRFFVLLALYVVFVRVVDMD